MTSVTATLEPYNPQFTNGGIPVELVKFTVTGLTQKDIHCNIAVFHSDRQVGATSMGAGMVANQAVAMEAVPVSVEGDTFDGNPSDAHVVCVANANPFGHS